MCTVVVTILVLDTATLPASDRAEAFQTTVSANCSTSVAVFNDKTDVRATMHVYDLGPAKVFNIDASGTILRRTPQMSRAADKCEITLALPVRASNQLLWNRDEHQYGPHDLMLVDLSAPYVYRWPDHGASYAFHVDYDHLGLPMDTIHRASRNLRASPLYPLVQAHIRSIVTEAHTIADSGASYHLGAASVELMHALVVSAAGDTRRSTDSHRTSTASRVEAFIRLHLRDPDLSPARIAAENSLSVRALYKLYEDKPGPTLEQSIIDLRLRGARTDLSHPGLRHRSIASIARSWGFTNPSFFSSRFRHTFGTTPRQWRTESTTGSRRS